MLGAVKKSLGGGLCPPPLPVSPEPAFPLLALPCPSCSWQGKPWWDPARTIPVPSRAELDDFCLSLGKCSGEKRCPCVSSASPRRPSCWLMSHQRPGGACKEPGYTLLAPDLQDQEQMSGSSRAGLYKNFKDRFSRK